MFSRAQGNAMSQGSCQTPRPSPSCQVALRALVCVHRKAHTLIVPRALHVVDVLEHLVVDTLGVLDPALGVGAGDNGAAELRDLLNGIDSNVAGAVDDDLLALEGIAGALEVLVDEVDQSVAGSLGAGERAAKGEALAGEERQSTRS